MWNAGVTQVHVDPRHTPLIKINHDDKSGKDFVKLNLCRDPTSGKLDPYEFTMALFDNGNPEEFLLFFFNFNMTLVESGTLGTDTKVHYLITLVRR